MRFIHTYTEFPTKEERTIWTAGTKRELMISLHFVVDLVRSVVRSRSRRRRQMHIRDDARPRRVASPSALPPTVHRSPASTGSPVHQWLPRATVRARTMMAASAESKNDGGERESETMLVGLCTRARERGPLQNVCVFLSVGVCVCVWSLERISWNSGARASSPRFTGWRTMFGRRSLVSHLRHRLPTINPVYWRASALFSPPFLDVFSCGCLRVRARFYWAWPRPTRRKINKFPRTCWHIQGVFFFLGGPLKKIYFLNAMYLCAAIFFPLSRCYWKLEIILI